MLAGLLTLREVVTLVAVGKSQIGFCGSVTMLVSFGLVAVGWSLLVY